MLLMCLILDLWWDIIIEQVAYTHENWELSTAYNLPM